MRGSGLDFFGILKFSRKSFNTTRSFIKKLLFPDPYSKKDLQIIFSQCSENCEDQPCVAKCQRDFYVNIDCKR